MVGWWTRPATGHLPDASDFTRSPIPYRTVGRSLTHTLRGPAVPGHRELLQLRLKGADVLGDLGDLGV